MRWQLLLVATCQRCDCNLCRIAVPLVMQRFRASLPACHPKSIIRHCGRQKQNRKRTQKKWESKKKQKKTRMKPKTKRAKCVMRYFLLIFMFVSSGLCVSARERERVGLSGCARMSVSVKCAEWHIVFQSVASADRWKHLMLAICICRLTPRQPTRRQRALSKLPDRKCMPCFYWHYKWFGQGWDAAVKTWRLCSAKYVCAEKCATICRCNWERVFATRICHYFNRKAS